MDLVADLIALELVGFVCDPTTLETNACVCYQCRDEVRLSIIPVLAAAEQTHEPE